MWSVNSKLWYKTWNKYFIIAYRLSNEIYQLLLFVSSSSKAYILSILKLNTSEIDYNLPNTIYIRSNHFLINIIYGMFLIIKLLTI